VFDALASKRAYKDPWPRERIESIMREGRGTHFDPDLIDIMLEQWDDVERVRAAVDEQSC
jgi:putative two-component system response regulator